MKPITTESNAMKSQSILLFDVPSNHIEEPTVHSEYVIHVQDTFFKPMGLLLKGAKTITRVHSLINNVHEMLIGSKPFRGTSFETPLSIARLKDLANQNLISWPGDDKVIDESIAQVGVKFTIRVSGPLTHAMLWGYKSE